MPNTFINYIASLPSGSIKYYFCFISYSSKDQAFARHTHAALQQAGVRCWFATEDIHLPVPRQGR